MDSIQKYEEILIKYLLDELSIIDNVDVYGPNTAKNKTPVISFNIQGKNPIDVAIKLNNMKIESRAGCHCSTLAHHYLGLNSPASCRISSYFYNTIEEMEYVVKAIKKISLDRKIIIEDIQAFVASLE